MLRLKAYDKKRKCYIPQDCFAITGDGHILIAKCESVLLFPPGTPSADYAPCDEVTDETVEIKVVQEHGG